jgi:hypothetical protein
MLHVVGEELQYPAELSLNLVLVGGELVVLIEVLVLVNNKNVLVDQEESLLDHKMPTLLARPVLDGLWVLDGVISECSAMATFARLAWTLSVSRLVLEVSEASFESREVVPDVIGMGLDVTAQLEDE